MAELPRPIPWPLPDRLDLRDRLVAAYSSGRGYHDLLHLREVLERVADLGGGDEVTLVLAAWFHDAVYEGARDDEERSARLAEEELAGAEVDVEEVARLVRLTADHEAAADDLAGQILSDADLGILGSHPDRYAEYVAGVRRDFAFVSDADFRTGRLAVLEDLLGRPTLFHTERANRLWDTLARENLRSEIATLT